MFVGNYWAPATSGAGQTIIFQSIQLDEVIDIGTVTAIDPVEVLAEVVEVSTLRSTEEVCTLSEIDAMEVLVDG